ncbi:MAG: acetyltransferase [Nostoc sp. DedVER02]|uniref:acetyltransferase n=1 Tax=unclassified Nostoc TaxID=2593658 RepID=UPI002AD25E51|nr:MULTISPECIES: acetyltransferase [unclassified Nostoc]MDZ7989109.1 acetyltransferase [Nostoc sp. DedVER02]MDZ8113823.1 acetyltransferase [Nostoc sp. DedVER01b]
MTSSKNKKLIIIGDSAFAEVAYEYFTYDSSYEVVAFSVEQEFLRKDKLFGLPVTPFESLEKDYNSDEYQVFVAIVYTQLNRLRSRLCFEAKQKGFKLASYISSRAFVWQNVQIGEHCFIFEGNVVQAFVQLEENVILWSGNHIGHHSYIHKNCFISSHVVISGFVELGENCFLGVNSTISNNVKIGKDCWIGPGIIITKDVPEGLLYGPVKPEPAKVNALKFFKVKD